MRLLVKIELDTTTSNPLVASGQIGDVIGGVLGKLQPEAAYFLAEGGRRTSYLVVEVPDSSYIPSLAEPFWQQLNAAVEILPCMNLDELQAGLARLA